MAGSYLITIKDKLKCCGCSACANICPMECISMIRDEEGFLYPDVDKSKCVNCGKCDSVCICNSKEKNRLTEPQTYAMRAADDNLRENSSSGGVFSLVSDLFLKADGIVYGVAMGEDNKSCSFVRITNAGELYKLRGSKYLQANANNVYIQVKSDLEKGRLVLFSGVPCQIIALHLFLNKEYENLVCIEVVCHGTPSQLLWEKYINYLENKNKVKIGAVNFRNKSSGWKNFSLALSGNGFAQIKDISQDPYMIMFLKNYSLRPSCYNCRAKTMDSKADLTIADYWGIHKILPDMDDDKGTSLIMINTEKGMSIFDKIKGFTTYVETPYDFAVANNSAYLYSCEMPKQREEFFKDFNSKSFGFMIKKYGSKSFFKKIKKKAHSFLTKVLR